jgi:hypothetical protein
LQFSVLTSKQNKVHDEMMTEGGASKKNETKHSGEYKPPKKRKNKTKKNQKTKNTDTQIHAKP